MVIWYLVESEGTVKTCVRLDIYMLQSSAAQWFRVKGNDYTQVLVKLDGQMRVNLEFFK